MDLYENLMLKQQLNNTSGPCYSEDGKLISATGGSSTPHSGTKDAQEYLNKLIAKSSEKIR